MLHVGGGSEERGALMLNVVCVVCEGHVKLPGGSWLPAWMQAGAQGMWSQGRQPVQELWLLVPPWSVWKGGLVKISLEKCLWGHLSLRSVSCPFSLTGMVNYLSASLMSWISSPRADWEQELIWEKQPDTHPNACRGERRRGVGRGTVL